MDVTAYFSVPQSLAFAPIPCLCPEAQWSTPVIPAHCKSRQENEGLELLCKVIVSYIASLSPALATKVSKTGEGGLTKGIP